MPATKTQLAKYIGASKGKSGSKAAGRKPKFNFSSVTQASSGAPF